MVGEVGSPVIMGDELGKPMVSVCCITYNQREYIEDALDSILAQKTEFPFELLIHDDASTDGTSDIIREYEKRYPEIIRAYIETSNQYHKMQSYLFGRFAQESRGKYVALCEGDDYWIDRSKLQKQVDYLERHPDCSEICHGAWVVDATTGEKIGTMSPTAESRVLTEREVLVNWGIPTASRVYRRENLDELVEKWKFRYWVGDYPSAVYSLTKGHFYCSSELMSVYRYRSHASWSSALVNEDGEVENARNFLILLDNIDVCSDYRFHQYIVEAASVYVKILLGRGCCDEKSRLFNEVNNSLDGVDRLKVAAKRLIWFLGFRVVADGWDEKAARRIVRRDKKQRC